MGLAYLDIDQVFALSGNLPLPADLIHNGGGDALTAIPLGIEESI